MTAPESTAEPTGPVFACTDCTWHSIPGEYPEARACPRCGECVVLCQCEDWRFAPSSLPPVSTERQT